MLSTIRNHKQGHGTHYSPTCALAHGFGHDWPAFTGRAGFAPMGLVFSRRNLAGCNSRSLYSHRRAVTPAVRRSGGEGFLHLRSRTLSMQRHGSRRSAAHSTPVKPSLQLIAYRVTIHNRVLSNACSLAGSNNASKWEQSLGKVIHDHGRFSQARGCHV